MAKIVRYDGDLKAFAIDSTGTNRTVFGGVSQSDTLDDNVNADYRLGWQIVEVNEFPSKQDFNALGFTLGQLLSYLHQVGIPEWNDSQEYHTNSITNRNGVVYVSQSDDNVGNDPENDSVNWDNPIASISPTTVSGTATFTNSTNNISLTGIGSIGLEIGDVVSVSGSVSNDKDFTVEFITDANNVIVNEAHAGGSTSKSLIDETVEVSISLLAKWYNAPLGLGQGRVSVISSRSIGSTFTNTTKRAIPVYVGVTETIGSNFRNDMLLDSGTVSIIQSNAEAAEDSRFSHSIIVPPDDTYRSNTTLGTVTLELWQEVR